MGYYDGTKLLSLMDIDGNKPEIYICTTNRTGGKTTYFGRMLVNRFINKGKKFGLVYRYSYELADCHDKFFKDINTLFFPNYTMQAKMMGKGLFAYLFLNGEHCGYAFSLNNAEKIKKMSHLFSDCDSLLIDEFQSETNQYCADEIKKFLSLHTSVARGQGEQRRYVPVYLIGNPVTILNPYYVSMKISDRIRSDTKFMKGKGWVLEQGYNETASLAMKESGVMKAFAQDDYVAYSSEGIYLNDNYTFVDKPSGSSRYKCTIKCDGKHYGIREYADEGILYCDNSADLTFPIKIAVTTDDHNINYVMLKNNDFFINLMRFYFTKGCFRFKNLECKSAVLKMLSF